MKIEITRDTKIASIITIIGMLMVYVIYPNFVIIVPLGILIILFFSYPGTEKVGMVGMARHLQTTYVITLIGAIGIILLIY